MRVYCTEIVKKVGFRPQYVQADCGIKNGILAGIQCSFLMSQDARSLCSQVWIVTRHSLIRESKTGDPILEKVLLLG